MSNPLKLRLLNQVTRLFGQGIRRRFGLQAELEKELKAARGNKPRADPIKPLEVVVVAIIIGHGVFMSYLRQGPIHCISGSFGQYLWFPYGRFFTYRKGIEEQLKEQKTSDIAAGLDSRIRIMLE